MNRLEKKRFATASQKARHSSQKDEHPTRDEERENHYARLTLSLA